MARSTNIGDHHVARRYALIIGVNDYRQHDPSGRKNLRGALNNARIYVTLARRVGIPDKNIRVLLDADPGDQFAGISVSRPTRDGILDATLWLAEQLLRPNSTGMLAWSGHGVAREGTLALCPSDLGPRLENLIPIAELDTLFTAQARLTVFLDTCFAGDLTPDHTDIPAAFNLKNTVVLSSCGANQRSSEYPFHGEWTGAFTRAVDLLLESPFPSDGPITPVDVATRTRQILAALSIPQQPVAESFFPGFLKQPLLGVGLPSRNQHATMEMLPGTTGPGYTIVILSYGSTTGHVVVVGDSDILFGPLQGGTRYSTTARMWKANRSYWFFPGGIPSSFTMQAMADQDSAYTPLNPDNFAPVPANAWGVYSNATTSSSVSNPAVGYTVQYSSGGNTITCGHLAVVSGALKWYFNGTQYADFQSAQGASTVISVNGDAQTLSGSYDLYNDPAANP